MGKCKFGGAGTAIVVIVLHIKGRQPRLLPLAPRSHAPSQMPRRKSTGCEDTEDELAEEFVRLTTGDVSLSQRIQAMGARYRTRPVTAPSSVTPSSRRQAGTQHSPSCSHHTSTSAFTAATSDPVSSVSHGKPSSKRSSTTSIRQPQRRASTASRSSSVTSSAAESEDSDHTPTPSRAVPPKNVTPRTSAHIVGNIFQQSISAAPTRPSPTTSKSSPSGVGSTGAAPPRVNTRSATVPPSSTRTVLPASNVRCGGVTKKGQPCKNLVGRSTALGDIDSSADEDIPRYCYLHLRKVFECEGFTSNASDKWVAYSGERTTLTKSSQLKKSRLDSSLSSRRYPSCS